jgi:excinuclease UvrABC nuclease subunit
MNPTVINPLALPSLPLANRSTLPSCPAVYFVLEGDRVLYIGRSRNLQQRWIAHHRYSQLQGFNNVRIAWLECSEPSLLPEIETALIEYFQPSLNGELIPSSLAKIMIYAPRDLKEAIERLAKKENRSLSNYIVTALQRLAGEEKEQVIDTESHDTGEVR